MDAADGHAQLFTKGGKEIHPLLLGVQQGQADRRLRQLEGQAGEARPGAHVDQPRIPEIGKAQQAQTVQKMAAGRFLLPHDGGQVHDPVGLAEEGIIGFKALQRRGAQFQAPFRRAGEQHFTQAHVFSL